MYNRQKWIFSLDECDLLDCLGLGSNQCVQGKCVCGTFGGLCPDGKPVCDGDGDNAICKCYSGSCAEPNPVCDQDGTCKVCNKIEHIAKSTHIL